ncbi:MAG: DUF5678 domain-containing protein [Candidatus Pacearchaeota archaeon]|nr:DUF5678 domain-containing protein [Candidatus Pacearchaeota archaeon]
MEHTLEQNYEVYLQTNLDSYLGEWVAICENRVVSHGKNVKKVFEEARLKYPNKKPLLTKVPSKETLIF